MGLRPAAARSRAFAGKGPNGSRSGGSSCTAKAGTRSRRISGRCSAHVRAPFHGARRLPLDAHRILAVPLQRKTPTRQLGIPSAGSRNDHLAKLATRFRYALSTDQLGRGAVNALTSKPDQSPGQITVPVHLIPTHGLSRHLQPPHSPRGYLPIQVATAVANCASLAMVPIVQPTSTGTLGLEAFRVSPPFPQRRRRANRLLRKPQPYFGEAAL